MEIIDFDTAWNNKAKEDILTELSETIGLLRSFLFEHSGSEYCDIIQAEIKRLESLMVKLSIP